MVPFERIGAICCKKHDLKRKKTPGRQSAPVKTFSADAQINGMLIKCIEYSSKHY
ncbi:hypothetical protein ANACOL_01284 [Anaerotruncus colihominis DSM 17241]|uniref:Uncharacterized protein n=1 Tax=Anaerotruncus colihominis DSM 17241 TaxID=445972 RepID=B0P938_9FIRM|nr:hypothetical protein ANACOL_01284 [Anaerotruncus colihominis DSM 17241]